MKRLFSALTAAALLVLTACGQTAADPAPDPQPPAQSTAPAAGTDPADAGANVLIAYFTVPETDDVDTVSSASRVATDNGVVGNTQFIAQAIQQAVDGDLFAIETVQQYPGTHDELLDFAYNELREYARPELTSQIENLDDYDTIFLGYPNWNSDLPMPLYTFLESYDFSGKTIIPFVTHGGSGFSRTVSTIQKLQPEAAVIEDGLSISRGDVADAAQQAMEWASSLVG